MTEIMTRIVAEFRADGPDHGYNGDVDSLALLFWQGEKVAYDRLRILAHQGFDVAAWKTRTIGRYMALLALAGVEAGEGMKGRP
jgi:hypothetical protein